MNTLCDSCSKVNCKKFLFEYECSDYEPIYKTAEVINLFFGMSKTMQKSVYEIMKITQIKEEL